ncbi:MAG: hypothetical protein IJG25_05675, partial [Thermoguttaceae bacterium]|nr:hypothetical protein [Thermoguttaceae bacterium]
ADEQSQTVRQKNAHERISLLGRPRRGTLKACKIKAVMLFIDFYRHAGKVWGIFLFNFGV